MEEDEGMGVEYEAEMDARAEYDTMQEANAMADAEAQADAEQVRVEYEEQFKIKPKTIKNIINDNIINVLELNKFVCSWIRLMQEDSAIGSSVFEHDGYLFDINNSVTLLKHIFDITDEDLKGGLK